MRSEGNKLYVVVVVVVVVKRILVSTGFPPNGAQLFLTVFLTVSRDN